jgi:hypothetical protein
MKNSTSSSLLMMYCSLSAFLLLTVHAHAVKFIISVHPGEIIAYPAAVNQRVNAIEDGIVNVDILITIEYLKGARGHHIVLYFG